MMIKKFYMMSLLVLVSLSLSAAQAPDQFGGWEPDLAIVDFDAVGTPRVAGHGQNHGVCSAPRKKRPHGIDHARLAPVAKTLFADETPEQEPRAAVPVRTPAPSRSAALLGAQRRQARAITPDENDENRL